MEKVKDKNTYNRWFAAADLSLLEEIQHHNPYASDDKMKAWNNIVESLNNAQLFKKPTDARALKERMDTLIRWYKAADLRKKSRSGTEEQYGRMEELLQDILSLLESADETRRQKTKASEEMKAQQGRLKKSMRAAGEVGRKGSEASADSPTGETETYEEWMEKNPGLDKNDYMRDMQGRQSGSGLDEAGESSSCTGSSGIRSSRKSKEKSVDNDVLWMDFMREQDDKKLKFKEKKAADEKEIRLKELDNERFRLEIEKAKWEALVKRNNVDDVFLS